MSVLMKVVSICRSRSGLAWASCSDRKWAGSILLGAVIAFFSWSAVRGFPEDHAVAAFTCRARWSPGPSHTTLVDATTGTGGSSVRTVEPPARSGATRRRRCPGEVRCASDPARPPGKRHRAGRHARSDGEDATDRLAEGGRRI